MKITNEDIEQIRLAREAGILPPEATTEEETESINAIFNNNNSDELEAICDKYNIDIKAVIEDEIRKKIRGLL